MALAVADAAQEAESTLLVYYVGHGLIGPGDELYLAATATDRLTPGLAAHQALSFSALREALTLCRAASVIVVLDCCFSGRARLGAGTPQPAAFSLPSGHGMYLMGSAEQLALAPDDAEHTALTGELISLLRDGDPRAPRLLTLDDVYDHLFRALRSRGGPLPAARQATAPADSSSPSTRPRRPPTSRTAPRPRNRRRAPARTRASTRSPWTTRSSSTAGRSWSTNCSAAASRPWSRGGRWRWSARRAQARPHCCTPDSSRPYRPELRCCPVRRPGPAWS
ncbi:hypothetical protein O1M54_37210 [Streptomyces diastatochromogenes]|nr:hypothetical protein [Streptomyces diastatochromogenes]